MARARGKGRPGQGRPGQSKPRASRRRNVSPETVARILHELHYSEKSQTQIASEADVNPDCVYKLNLMHNARSLEESEAIGKASESRTKLAKRVKIGAFTTEEKTRLLQENEKGIFLVAGRNWHKFYRILKAEFSSLNDFVSAATSRAFEQLDYYDPRRKEPSGKGRTVGIWIMDSVELFTKTKCSSLFSKQKTMGRTPEERRAKRLAAEQRNRKREINRRLMLIPKSAKKFLRALGLKVEEVVELGFQDIKAQLLKATDSKGAGLSAREKVVVRARLEGKTFTEAGRLLTVSREISRLLEKSAIVKMKRHLNPTK